MLYVIQIQIMQNIQRRSRDYKLMEFIDSYRKIIQKIILMQKRNKLNQKANPGTQLLMF